MKKMPNIICKFFLFLFLFNIIIQNSRGMSSKRIAKENYGYYIYELAKVPAVQQRQRQQQQHSPNADFSSFECGTSKYYPPPPSLQKKQQKRGNKPLSVIHGHIVPDENALPWMAFMFYGVDRLNKTYHQLCSATIVGRNRILTAGHCVADFYLQNSTMFNNTGPWPPVKTDYFTILFGTTVLPPDPDANSKSAAAGVWRKSSKIIPHPMYRYTYWWENTYDDLALVEFSEPLEFSSSIQPVCLWAKQIIPVDAAADNDNDSAKSATEYVIAGWGMINRYNYTGSDLLHDGFVKTIDNRICYRASLAAKETFAFDPIKGDSGGGMFYKVDGLHWHQVGINSAMLGGGVCHPPGVFTRISTYCSWIAEATEGEVKCID